MKYLSNAFSISMVAKHVTSYIRIEEISVDKFCEEARVAISAVGHESTANLITQICNVPIKVNRQPISLDAGDRLYVIQILERLPEGKVLSNVELIDLLEKKKIKFFEVDVFETVD